MAQEEERGKRMKLKPFQSLTAILGVLTGSFKREKFAGWRRTIVA